MSKLEQVMALENHFGIQYLLDSAYRILNNPIYMIDINYNMLAYTGLSIDDPHWDEVVTTGTLSSETMEVLANEGLIEDITNAEKIALLRNEKLRYTKATCHLRNRDQFNVGLIMMSECDTSFDEECLTVFQALADRITEEIQDYEYFSLLEMTYHENKINMLLDGTVQNPLMYNPHAQALYEGFEDYLYVAVVKTRRNALLESVYRRKLVYYQSLLKTKYPSFKYSVYEDHIVILMSSRYNYFYSVPFISAYASLFEQNGLYMGISDSFENIYELRKYYDQAVDALTDGMISKDNQRIFLYRRDR